MPLLKPHPSLAVVGATGAVGTEMLRVLEQRRFAHGPIRLLASARSAGVRLTYRGEPHEIRPLDAAALHGVDVALFSAGSSTSKQFAPAARAAGCVVIDNSSAFRADDACPLVIPEVNPRALDTLRAAPAGTGAIIGVPNCSAIVLLVAIEPLRAAFGIERVTVATYQAASGAGARAIDELVTQTRDVLAGKPAVPQIFAEPYAFNLFSHNTPIDPDTGYNVEEQKMVSESARIWRTAGVPGPELPRLSATCIRVPVIRAHSQAVTLTLRSPATETHLRAALARAPGVRIVDDRAANAFPTPLKASGQDDILVGRIRPDLSQTDAGPLAPGAPTRGWHLFLSGDQLRKGAALNAVQIAEALMR